MALLRAANLALRFLLELCLLAALGWIGFQLGESMIAKIALAILAPLLAAIVWGIFVAPRAKIIVSVWMWFFIQLLLFGLAVVGLAVLGKQQLACIFAGVVSINILLMVLWRQHDDMKQLIREP